MWKGMMWWTLRFCVDPQARQVGFCLRNWLRTEGQWVDLCGVIEDVAACLGACSSGWCLE